MISAKEALNRTQRNQPNWREDARNIIESDITLISGIGQHNHITIYSHQYHYPDDVIIEELRVLGYIVVQSGKEVYISW